MSNDWIRALRKECRRTSQRHAAQMIGYSPTTVSQVLTGSYNGDLGSIENAVRGALMGATVECPIIGEIPRNRCIDHQRRAGRFAATNPLRVQLHHQCPVCPHAQGKS